MHLEHFNSLSKIVLILEYDGRHYSGFQWQIGRKTVQSSLEGAILKVTGEFRRVIPASRTDAGVHASFQVVSFYTKSLLPAQTLLKAINYYLPHDIAVKAAGQVEADFNVRRDAISREYIYSIYNSPLRSPLLSGISYQVPYQLDVNLMNVACAEILGEHDFTSFASVKGTLKNTCKHIFKAVFERNAALLKFHIVADSFLTHQVRNTVGFLLHIGAGRRTIEELKRIMTQFSPGSAGPAVPAYGLCLTRVNYPREMELKYEDLFNQGW